MTVYTIPHVGKASIDEPKTASFLGSAGDGLIYQGNYERIKLRAFTLVWENISHQEGTDILTACLLGCCKGNRLKLPDVGMCAPVQDFIEEEWSNFTCKITVKLVELRA